MHKCTVCFINNNLSCNSNWWFTICICRLNTIPYCIPHFLRLFFFDIAIVQRLYNDWSEFLSSGFCTRSLLLLHCSVRLLRHTYTHTHIHSELAQRNPSHFHWVEMKYSASYQATRTTQNRHFFFHSDISFFWAKCTDDLLSKLSAWHVDGEQWIVVDYAAMSLKSVYETEHVLSMYFDFRLEWYVNDKSCYAWI